FQRVLKLDPETVGTAVEFLESRGFIQKSAQGYQIGSRRIHLATGSPMLPRHHANWRMKAIEAVDHSREGDLHYSGIVGLSRKDATLFREKLLALIAEFEAILKDSQEEVPVAIVMD